jgi:hypothetical protein
MLEIDVPLLIWIQVVLIQQSELLNLVIML